MADQHRATDGQWACIKRQADTLPASLWPLALAVAQHRATDGQWACIKRQADKFLNNTTYSTILELLHRIEALEAPQSGSIDLSHLSDDEREKMARWIANPDRFEALEATQHAHVDASHVIDPEKEKMAQEFMQAAGFAPRWSDFDRFFAGIQAPQSATTAQPNHREIPDSSLVKRVAISMAQPGIRTWDEMAADAIREVAAWLREQKVYGVGWVWAVERLEEEAKR